MTKERVLFWALRIPRAQALAQVEPLARVLGGEERAAEGFRRTRPEGWHVTLFYMGAVPPSRVSELCNRMEAHFGALKLEAIDFEWSGTGAFPARGRERVLWLGVRERGERSGRLAELQRAVVAGLAAFGWDVGGNETPFRPHVTVARPRRGGGAPEIASAFYEFAPKASFECPVVELMESVRGAEVARYETVFRLPLHPRGS